MAETNTTLESNFPLIKNKIKKKTWCLDLTPENMAWVCNLKNPLQVILCSAKTTVLKDLPTVLLISDQVLVIPQVLLFWP